MRVNRQNLYLVLLLIAQFFWAGNFIIGRAIHSAIPPFTLAFYRWLWVSVLLFPWTYRLMPPYKAKIKKHFWPILIWSLLSIVIYTPIIYLGLHSTSVLSGSLMIATIPVLITVFSTVIIRYKLSIKIIFGIIVSLVGVLLILTHGQMMRLLGIHYNIGDVIIFIDAIIWALAAVLYKKFAIPLPPIIFLFITSCIGTIMLFPCFLIEHHLGYSMHYHWITVGSIAYTAIFSSIISFSFWNIGIQQIGPAKSGYFLNLLPVFSSILAIIFLGESLHIYHVIGFSLVFIGIILSSSQKRWNTQPSEMLSDLTLD